jgi:hypothetical protein
MSRARIIAADHDAVGMLEILDGGAFAQEFQIGHHREFRLRLCFANDALDLIAGADRHGRLGDHHRGAAERGRDLARGVIDEAQIGMAIAAPRRRTDRDEHRVGAFDRAGQIVGEFQPTGARIGGDQFHEPRVVNRHFATQQSSDFSRVLVDTGHVVAKVSEAGPGDEADIAGADHGNAHNTLFPNWIRRTSEAIVGF